MAVQTAHPAEKAPKARPEKVPQPRQPTRRLSHHRLRSPPPWTLHCTQQPLELRGKRLSCAAQPTPHPPHPRTAALPRNLGTRTWTIRAQARLDGSKGRIAIRADILRQHRMADPATRAPHTTQQLPHSSEIASVPAMTSQGTPLTLRSRAAQLGDRTTVHLLPVLLAANSANAYHGLLSEARRVSSPSAKTSRSTRRASLCLADLRHGKPSRIAAATNLPNHAEDWKKIRPRPRNKPGVYTAGPVSGTVPGRRGPHEP